MTQDARDWYVLTVPPQSEFAVEKAVKAKGHDALVPVEYKWRRRNGHSKHKRRKAYPVYPRYVFMGTKNPPEWQDINSIQPAPVRPISFGGQPAKIAADDVARLVTRTSDDLPSNFNLHKALKEGQIARITDGPFTGYQAHIHKIEGDRATVSLRMLGSDRSVPVPLSQLDAA